MSMLRRIHCDRCKAESDYIPTGEYVHEFAKRVGWTTINGKQHACPNCKVRNVKAGAKQTVQALRNQLSGMLSEDQLHAIDVLLHGTGMKRRTKAEIQKEQLNLGLLKTEAKVALREMAAKTHPKSAQRKRHEQRTRR